MTIHPLIENYVKEFSLDQKTEQTFFSYVEARSGFFHLVSSFFCPSSSSSVASEVERNLIGKNLTLKKYLEKVQKLISLCPTREEQLEVTERVFKYCIDPQEIFRRVDVMKIFQKIFPNENTNVFLKKDYGIEGLMESVKVVNERLLRCSQRVILPGMFTKEKIYLE